MFQPQTDPPMAIDTGLPEMPLLALRISLFETGTAIGILAQHGICDADAEYSSVNRL